MQIDYNKLVRDHIPDLIQRNGDHCETVIIEDDEAYRSALREKLVEEAREVAGASKDEMLTELADLYEVMDSLLHTYAIEPAAVKAKQEQRRNERGGFARRIRLLRTWQDND